MKHELTYKYLHAVDADGFVWTKLPVELLFAEDWQLLGKGIESATDAWRCFNQRIRGRSILRLRGHLDLYESFMRGRPGPENYLSYWRSIHETRGLTAPDEAATLNGRHDQYLAFDRHVAAADLAPLTVTAVFDEATHRFVLDDGHHRASFLVSSGWRHVPARVPYGQFDRFVNIHGSWEVATFLEANGITEVYCPILNPMAPPIAPCRDTTRGSRLDRILYFLGDYETTGPILDVGCNGGFFTHHFLREGATVVGVDTHEPHIALARRLSSLYRLPDVFHHADAVDLMGERTYEAALLLTVLYHWIAAGPASYRPRLRQLHDSVTDFIVWESGHDPDFEKRLITDFGKFTRYESLGRTYGTGRSRELGIFMRPGCALDIATGPSRQGTPPQNGPPVTTTTAHVP